MKELMFYIKHLGVLPQVLYLQRRCRHIKTYKEYLSWLNSDEHCTPIREELGQWSRLIK